jgi:hypothetical protein
MRKKTVETLMMARFPKSLIVMVNGLVKPKMDGIEVKFSRKKNLIPRSCSNLDEICKFKV